ncbi:class I SAM-dependent methyltransferase [Williamsia herbipolensis]|uniref:Class I SAM-dependent methyltransferase n=1 Tax=Williamsia herbipolensis TaxID=1603258 RepID=A0AAU4K7J0_9NOCA|nr:class I SAM-dependent methyltransferase [Williamsia herbipolensis]
MRKRPAPSSSHAADSPRWNHNIHYHRLILDTVPADAQTALDIGTGNGLLAAELAEIVPDVIGIDVHAPVVETAKAESSDVRWIVGDAMTYPFEPGSFDVVASVATLHHIPDIDAALHRCADLAAPGGVVAIVGLGRTSRPREVALHIAGLVQHQYLSRRRGLWEHTAPIVWPPPHTYTEVEAAVARVMPGAVFRLLPLWRYILVWHKPR